MGEQLSWGRGGPAAQQPSQAWGWVQLDSGTGASLVLLRTPLFPKCRRWRTRQTACGEVWTPQGLGVYCVCVCPRESPVPWVGGCHFCFLYAGKDPPAHSTGDSLHWAESSSTHGRLDRQVNFWPAAAGPVLSAERDVRTGHLQALTTPRAAMPPPSPSELWSPPNWVLNWGQLGQGSRPPAPASPNPPMPLPDPRPRHLLRGALPIPGKDRVGNGGDALTCAQAA